MFLGGEGGYTRSGKLWSRGSFLLIAGGHTWTLDEESGKGIMVKLPLRAAVRHVRMTQLGHFMIGYAVFGKARVWLSGCYGSDGLPMDVDKVPYQNMVPLPPELEREFWDGGGHNTCGKEGPSIYGWAKTHLKELRGVRG